ncbi:MAG: cupin domain-containing protein [Rhodomicrobiaceae bacterium]
MKPNHHPFPETLISYASGTLPGALSGVIACHLSMCSECADHVRHLEMLGGLMLDRVEGASVDEASAGRQEAQRDTEGRIRLVENSSEATGDGLLPDPLARYLGGTGRKLTWEQAAEGVEQAPVSLPGGSGSMRLLRLAPGQHLLTHDRGGEIELVLVLQGVLSDKAGDHVRGDILDLTDDAGHQPVAAGDVDCICLVAGGAQQADRIRPAPPRLIRLLPDVRFRDYWSGPAAMAASVAVVLGLGLGWLLAGGPDADAVAMEDLVRTDGRRLVARGPLESALQSLPSGEEAALSPEGGTARLGVTMTFRNQAGDYCRQYRIEASSHDYSGIACRTGEEWAVKIHALVPPRISASEQPVPAGGEAEAAIDAAIGSLISGNPLAVEDEARLREKGWTE